MMIIIVVYAVTEVSIKTAILASTQMLATQNRAPFRWGLCMYVPSLNIKASYLVYRGGSVVPVGFYHCLCAFFVAVIFLTHHFIVCHHFCLSYITIS